MPPAGWMTNSGGWAASPVASWIRGLRPLSKRTSSLSMAVASAAMVGASNRAPRPGLRWQSSSTRSSSCTAESESPPRLKKSASVPSTVPGGRRSTSANSAARVCSVGVAGARPAVAPLNAGAGRALRSSLPLAVTGQSAMGTMAAGTM